MRFCWHIGDVVCIPNGVCYPANRLASSGEYGNQDAAINDANKAIQSLMCGDYAQSMKVFLGDFNGGLYVTGIQLTCAKGEVKEALGSATNKEVYVEFSADRNELGSLTINSGWYVDRILSKATGSYAGQKQPTSPEHTTQATCLDGRKSRLQAAFVKVGSILDSVQFAFNCYY